MSFLKLEADRRLKQNKLLKMEKLINWDKVVGAVGNLGRSGIGPSGYNIKSMIKALILQSWNSLSDAELEEALRVRLDFVVFSGFEGDVPDETTICRFRNLLVKHQAQEKIFAEVNRQLQLLNLQVKPTQGAVLDATLVKAAARPHEEVIEAVKNSNGNLENQSVMKKTSADQEATWKKKGKQYHFGYQVFATVAEEEGAIIKLHTTPANEAEITNLEAAISGVQCTKLLTDKGYASKSNNEYLHSQGIKSRIMKKAQRNKPLTQWQKKFNKGVAKTRWIVEQAFGTLKRKFNFDQTPYFSVAKTHAWAHIKATSFNLLKAVNKVVEIPKNWVAIG